MLCRLTPVVDPRLLTGIDTSDDAGVYLLNEDTALIQTLDFFPPIVDDPYIFGQIAAANSLSDVYAMGGKPITAMNIVAFPLDTLGADVLLEILRGGQDKVAEAGALLVGGHTIEDKEPKYGLSVTGIAAPHKVRTNAGSRVGDALILTKALGTGILMTAAKADMFTQGVGAATVGMAMLNKYAAEIMASYSVNACTDITGFGLLGHVSELAIASAVKVRIMSGALPILPEAVEAASMGLVPAGAYANREYLTKVEFADTVAVAMRDVCFDPQTSGGLLISLPMAEADSLVAELRQAGIDVAAIIGRVEAEGKGEIYVE